MHADTAACSSFATSPQPCTVTIIAGEKEEERAFKICQAKLMARSSFFRTIFAAGLWMDGDEPVRLPTIPPIVFGVYADWVNDSHLDYRKLNLYRTDGIPHAVLMADFAMDSDSRRDIRVDTETSQDTRVEAIHAKRHMFADFLLRLWTYGGILEDVAFQNLVSDELAEWSFNAPITHQLCDCTVHSPALHRVRRHAC
jgi:hypothetical protein